MHNPRGKGSPPVHRLLSLFPQTPESGSLYLSSKKLRRQKKEEQDKKHKRKIIITLCKATREFEKIKKKKAKRKEKKKAKLQNTIRNSWQLQDHDSQKKKTIKYQNDNLEMETSGALKKKKSFKFTDNH